MKTAKFLGTLLAVQVLVAPALASETPVAKVGVEIVNLGKITPNGPYRLWSAINKLLPAYADARGGAALQARVQGLRAIDAYGKKPGDVMLQTEAFRATLDQLRGRLNLDKIAVFSDPLGRAVTPAVVFVNAGFNMDGIIEVFHAAAKDANIHVGEFYNVPTAKGKSPSDVYALVELAARRLRLIQGS